MECGMERGTSAVNMGRECSAHSRIWSQITDSLNLVMEQFQDLFQ